MGDDGLVPIRDVADHFGIPLSTLHYWERRELITPVRRAGQRWYDTDQLYRIALIKAWRTTGQISVDRIAEMLADGSRWRELVPDLIAEVERRRAELDAALDYLDYLGTCSHEGGPEHCPRWRAKVSVPGRDRQADRGISSGATPAATASNTADAANAAV